MKALSFTRKKERYKMFTVTIKIQDNKFIGIHADLLHAKSDAIDAIASYYSITFEKAHAIAKHVKLQYTK